MTAATCGTYAGWNRHKKAGTPPCDPCKRAAAEYMAQLRRSPAQQQRDRFWRRTRAWALEELRQRHQCEYNAILRTLRGAS